MLKRLANRRRRGEWTRAVEWGSLGLMVGLSLVLCVLQYRWTGEVAEAARARLQGDLRIRLTEIAQDFDGRIAAASGALMVTGYDLDSMGREGAHQARWRQWAADTDLRPWFSRVYVAVPAASGGSVELFGLDLDTGRLAATVWPERWQDFQRQVERRLQDGMRGRPPHLEGSLPLIEMPVFGAHREELEWMLFEIDPDYLRQRWLPEQVERRLKDIDDGGFDLEIAGGSNVIYSSLPGGARIDRPDATARMLATEGRGGRGGPGGRNGGRGGGAGGGSRWTLSARHQSGSLDKLVERNRWRNLGVSVLLLLLLAAAGVVLIRYTARARRLAGMQFDFVAGITHELRTPLTVIRGAGHNLLNGVAPEKQQAYAQAIIRHSDQLTEMVEQILAFAVSRKPAADAVPLRQQVSAAELVDAALEAASADIQASGCEVEVDIAEDLPEAAGDPLTMRRALQNLVSNAARHAGSGRWIGIQAARSTDGSMVEFRVRDRGPGIAREEQDRIFEPFFRGAGTREKNVRGAGLGLSLVREAARAGGGDVKLAESTNAGCEFVLSLPAWGEEWRA